MKTGSNISATHTPYGPAHCSVHSWRQGTVSTCWRWSGTRMPSRKPPLLGQLPCQPWFLAGLLTTGGLVLKSPSGEFGVGLNNSVSSPTAGAALRRSWYRSGTRKLTGTTHGASWIAKAAVQGGTEKPEPCNCH